MKSEKITVALLVIALSFMLIFTDRAFIQSAYALSNTDITITDSSHMCYQASTDSFWVGTNTASTMVETYYRISAVTQEIVSSFTYNATTNSGLQDIACYDGGIFILLTAGAGANSRVVKLSNAGTELGIETYSVNGGLVHKIALAETPDLTLFLGRACRTGDDGYSGTATRVVQILNGDAGGGDDIEPVDGSSGNAFLGNRDCSSSTLGTNSISNLVWNEESGTNGVIITSTATMITMSNVGTNTFICQDTTGFSAIASDGISFDSDNDLFLIPDSTAVDIELQTEACATSSTITSANLGLSSILGTQVNEGENEIYVIGQVASGNSRFVAMNSSSINERLWTYNIPTFGASSGYVDYSSSNPVIAVSVFNSAMTRLIVTGETSTPDSGNQIDGRCGLGTALDCVGDRNTLNAIVGAPSITNASNNLFGQLGIVNSTNTDIKENGTGILMMLVTGTFFAGGLLFVIHQTNARGYTNIQVREIDPIYWLFLVVGVVSLAWYLQWIPDIVFYGMVVGLAGLFSFGIYRQVKGSGG